MAANLPPQFYKKEAELKKAESIDEKIVILEELLSMMPKHKASEKVQALIKTKISKYKKLKEKSPQTAKRPTAPVIDKEGAGQIIICGPPNSGKSTLLSSLTKANPNIADYPFTTKFPMPGMLPYQDINIQIVDTPSLSLEFSENWLGDILRRGDGLIFLFDLSSDEILDELEESLKILEKFKIKNENDFTFNKKILWIGNKVDSPKASEIKEIFLELYNGKIPQFLEISAKEKIHIEPLPEKIFNMLKIIRVYTKIQGKPPDMKNPYTLKKDSSLVELAGIIHKDLVKNFKYARLWRNREENPVVIGRENLLEDRDVVEIHD